MKKKLFIDTDIGSGVDDALALALALSSPEVELLGISTVYGDVARRSQLARRVLDEFGGAGVPVAAGESRTLGGVEPTTGVAQAAVLTADERRSVVDPDGVDLLIDSCARSPGETVLVALGPLTNVATALARRPALAESLAMLVIDGSDPTGRTVEDNFAADPQAAAAVLASGARVTLLGSDVTGACRLTSGQLDSLRSHGSRKLAFLDQLVRIWSASRSERTVLLGDPLTVACAVDPGFARFERRALRVETSGERAGAVAAGEGAGALVATAVEAERFARFFTGRILSAA